MILNYLNVLQELPSFGDETTNVYIKVDTYTVQSVSLNINLKM